MSPVEKLVCYFLFCIMLQELSAHENLDQISQLSLSDAIEIALKNNRQRIMSQHAVDIAESQYQQAIAAYWPSISFNINLTRRDESPSVTLPAESLSVPSPFGGTLDVPVNEREIKLVDRDTVVSSIELLYPIYTGGKRKAISEQAKVGVELAKEASRKSDLKVIFDVKRYYYACLLSEQLVDVSKNTLDGLKVILDISEALYKNGSVQVNKLDYLRTKIVVAMTESIHEEFVALEKAAYAALTTAMGLDWDSRIISLSETALPSNVVDLKLARLIDDAHLFNPDISTIELQIEANDARIDEATSGYFPVISFFSSARNVQTPFKQGLTNATNRDAWTVGLSLNYQLFEGMKTKYSISEAKSRRQLAAVKYLALKQTLALQIKNFFIQLHRARRQKAIGEQSLLTAEETTRLSVRSYRQASLKTRDVVEAQITEALIKTHYFKALHDVVSNIINLEFIVGTELGFEPFGVH